MIEVWKKLDDYTMYSVSSEGRVRNDETGRILRYTPHLHGYPTVGLYSGIRYGYTGSRRYAKVQVHVLVCTAFHGPKPPGQWVAHNNGIPSDIRESNLRWDSPRGNHADKQLHGTQLKGEKVPTSKLTMEEVLKIRADPRPDPVIGAEYGVSAGTVCDIQRRRTWAHLPD